MSHLPRSNKGSCNCSVARGLPITVLLPAAALVAPTWLCPGRLCWAALGWAAVGFGEVGCIPTYPSPSHLLSTHCIAGAWRKLQKSY